MHLLCVARHQYLAEHFARFFAQLGAVTTSVVGLDQAMTWAESNDTDGIVCEDDLLTKDALKHWSAHPRLSEAALIAVSLTREPSVTDSTEIAASFYLPRMTAEDASRVFAAVGAARGGVAAPSGQPWPGASTLSPAR